MVHYVQCGGDLLWSLPEGVHKLLEWLTGYVLMRISALEGSASYWIASKYPLDEHDRQVIAGEVS